MCSTLLIPSSNALELPGVCVELRRPCGYVLMRLTGFLSAPVLDDAASLLAEAIEDAPERTIVIDTRASYWPIDSDKPGGRVGEVLSCYGSWDLHVLCRDARAPVIATMGLLPPAAGGRLSVYEEEEEEALTAWLAARRLHTPAPVPRAGLRARLASELSGRAGPLRRLLGRTPSRMRRSAYRRAES
ncbi:MAG: hypothetical protein ACLFQ5_11175 [Oceanicaulis sp.]